VQLDNTIEGLVHISTLKDQNYNYDSNYHCLRGMQTNKIYALGDKVVIEVVKVDIKQGNIDFSLVE
jgi:ribonuclease R